MFTPAAVQYLKTIGLFLLLTDFIHMLQSAITGPLLSLSGLSDHFLSVEMQLETSVACLFVILVCRVMMLAADLEEQQRLTI